MYVKPSKSSPAALRKARYDAQVAQRNAEAKAKVVASLSKVSLVKATPTTFVKG